jgi:hypothetical protein
MNKAAETRTRMLACDSGACGSWCARLR